MDKSTWCNDPRHVRPEEPFGPKGQTRREFMYVGLVGGLGLTLGKYFGMTGPTAAKAEQKFYESKEGVAKSIIHIFLPGGMAQHETFDPKPYAPIEYRGPYGTIPTKLPGELFSENLPNIASVADKITVVRSMTHGEAAHERGNAQLFTLSAQPRARYPSFGSVISHGSPQEQPASYVAILPMANTSGPGYCPARTARSPRSTAAGGFQVRDLNLAQGLTRPASPAPQHAGGLRDHSRKIDKSDCAGQMTRSTHGPTRWSAQGCPRGVRRQRRADASGADGKNGRHADSHDRRSSSGRAVRVMTYGGGTTPEHQGRGIRSSRPLTRRTAARSTISTARVCWPDLVMVPGFGRTPKITRNRAATTGRGVQHPVGGRGIIAGRSTGLRLPGAEPTPTRHRGHGLHRLQPDGHHRRQGADGPRRPPDRDRRRRQGRLGTAGLIGTYTT